MHDDRHQVSPRAIVQRSTPWLVVFACTGAYGCAGDAESEAIRHWVRHREPGVVWIRDVLIRGDVPYTDVEMPEGAWDSPNLFPVLQEESGSQDKVVRGFVYLILSDFLTYHYRPLTREEGDTVVQLCSKGMHDANAGYRAEFLMAEDAIQDPQTLVVSGVDSRGLWLARRLKKDLIHIVDTGRTSLTRRIAMGIIEKLGPEAREALPVIREQLLSKHRGEVYAAQQAFMAITGTDLLPDPAVEGRIRERKKDRRGR